MNKEILVFLICFLYLSCVHWGDYKQVNLEPQKITDQDILVTGRSCSILLIPLVPKFDVAIKAALEKAQGKRGLKNPLIKDEYFFIFRCMSVEGYATDSI